MMKMLRDRIGDELSAVNGAGDPFGGDGIGKSRGITDEENPIARRAIGSRRQRDEKAVAIDRHWLDLVMLEVRLEALVEIRTLRPQREHADRKMFALGEDPAVSEGDLSEIELRDVAKPRERFGCYANFAFKRRHDAAFIGKTCRSRDGAVGTVGRDEKTRFHSSNRCSKVQRVLLPTQIQNSA